MKNYNLCFELTNFQKNETIFGVVMMDSKGGLIDYYISKEDPMISIKTEGTRWGNVKFTKESGRIVRISISGEYP